MGTKKRCRHEKMVSEASTSDSEAQIEETRQPPSSPAGLYGEGGIGKICVFGPPWREDYRREVR